MGVAVLDGRGLVEPLAARLDAPVTATTSEDHLEVVTRIADEVTHVVGLSPVPWPTAGDLHARCSATLPAYTGVVSWHALPVLADRLAEAVAPGVRAGAHLLVTAPDPGPDTEPDDLVFLREVTEQLEARTSPVSRSLAWRGDTRTPTAVEALRSVVEAHGHRDVVECPVAPGTGADPALLEAADELGARLTCADLGRTTLVSLLAAVVDTVAEHEGLA